MNVQEYKSYDGLGLAALIESREVSAEEILAAAIESIEQHNPGLNAVINKMYAQAEETLKEPLPEGPFKGVPILLKDIIQEIEGEKISSGSKVFHNYRAKRDSNYVKSIRNTGAVITGQTNVPEFALLGITESVYHGPARNPWNSGHTPGGSSGGSASAVASGMVPIAGASDGGGSIRIPGSYTGLFGLKPTRGRTPAGPSLGRHWQGASIDHILSRSVRDSAAMLDAIHTHEKGAAFHAPPYHGSYLNECKLKQEAYTFAYSTRSPMGTEVDSEAVKAVLKTVAWLEEQGHTVIEKAAPPDGNIIAKSYLTMCFGEVAASLSSLESVLGRKAKRSDVEPVTWMMGMLGRALTAEELILSLREWDKASYEMETFHESYDFYLTPATACPAPKIGELNPGKAEAMLIKLSGQLRAGKVLKKIGIVDQIAENNLKRTPFTQLANLTGQPAMTLPLHLTEDGLPLGVQVMAARGREDLLFRLAGQIEQSELWIKAETNPLY
ncbi:amidase [Metabacillus sp. GX 13764]|uniref:amidase family protein n=1 Tax=Metabacillus kandeliae TaxID=2900151 RepID=UPI001E656B62|nr:amidase [Metabacillus kandeliae]